ncbi:MAG TPA: recombinase family protein [Candidatus Moranbacteria bacterium]|nr:recombinase family protein [Candidatus Moranbacteria bacterium]HRZ33468.1 recombinase family protein [Candidatus Moranbacteria bacterium]
MKAIILARVSTEEQKDAGNSLPAQIHRLKEYCKTKGFAVLEIFSFDESAYKQKRDEFDKAIDLVKKSKDKIVVCFDKVDRFTRNVFDKRVPLLYDLAMQDKIELHFVSDNLVISSNISAAEKFHFGINLGLAKYYSDAISDNVKRAYEQKLRNGEWIGQAYLGYKNITLENEKKHIIIDKDKEFLVLKMFQLYATGKFSMKKLAQEMNDRGLRSRSGMKMTTSQVHAILRNPFYYGVMRVKGKLYPHKYQPIVSRYLFEKVQEVINGYNRQNFKRTNNPYIFRGLIKCSHCGLAITPELQKGHVYYHCTNYYGTCPDKGIKWLREDELVDQTKDLFQSLKLEPEALDRLKDELRTIHDAEKVYYEKNKATIQRKIGNIDARLKVMYRDRLDGRITADEYDKMAIEYTQERENLNTQLQEHSSADRDFSLTANKVLDLSQRALELFQNSEPQEKTQLLGFLLQNLTLNAGKLSFEVKAPFNGIMEYAKTKEWLRR